METIVSAAIQDERSIIYSMPKPKRHHDIIYAMVRARIKESDDHKKGFLTSEGRFVDRVEGLEIAEAADQIPGSQAGFTKLYTESLW